MRILKVEFGALAKQISTVKTSDRILYNTKFLPLKYGSGLSY